VLAYQSWRERYARCPGRVAAFGDLDHVEPRVLPEDHTNWRLTYAVVGTNEADVRTWLDDLAPEGQVLWTSEPNPRHGHVCAVRCVLVDADWFSSPESKSALAEGKRWIVRRTHEMGWRVERAV
jgi:hypothetical protein